MKAIFTRLTSLLTLSFIIGTASAQNVGVDETNPVEKLDVNGAVRIGNTSSNNAGTIRYVSGSQKFQINIAGTWYDIATGNLAYINDFSYNATTNELSITEGSTVHTVDLNDLQDNTDDQTISLSSDVLSIEDGNTVDLSGYMDNTDSQTLSYNPTSNVLSLLNGGTVDLSDLQDNTDDQAISYNAVTNVITLEDGGTIDLSDLQDNSDDQAISYNAATNVITLEDGGTIDLSDLQDNTDDQAISYNATSNVLTLEDGGTVDLTDLQDNTDDQTLQEVYDENGNNVLMNATTGDVRFRTSSDELLLLDETNGRVGIGTTAPSAKLHVDNTYSATVTEMARFVHRRSDISNNDEGSYLAFKIIDGNNGAATYDHARISWKNNGNGTDENEGELGFWTATNGVVSQKMTINRNGNVGVGTATPSEKLHIQGDARISSLGGSGTKLVQADNNGVLTISSMDPSVTPQGSGTTNYLARWTSSSNLGIGATYDNGTNVGIGTTSPSEKLHVEGNLRLANGGVIDDDATTQGNSDDWIKLNGYVEVKSNTDNYGIVLRDKDNSEYFGLTQKNGYSYLTDNSGSGNYFLRGNGANAYIRGDLTVYGGDVYENSGSLRLNSEDNLYFSMDYNNNDTDTRFMSWGKNDEGNSTNWIELMRLEETGNLGIGTSTVNNYVDIETGTARSGTHGTGYGLYVTANSGEAGSGVEFRHANGTQGIGFGYNTIYATGSNTAQDLKFNARGTGDLIFNVGGNNRVWMTDNGRMGVRTGSPSRELHVSGNMRVTGLGGSGTRLLQTDNSGNVNESSISPGSTPQGTGTTNYLARWTGTTSQGTGATWDNGTNVGIGITSPNHKFYVNGGTTRLNQNVGINRNARTDSYRLAMGGHIHMYNHAMNYVSQVHFNDNVRFYDEGNDSYLIYKWGDSGAGGIKFYDGDGTRQGYIYANGSTSPQFGMLDGDGNWFLRHREDNYTIFYINNTERMRIISNGNVGIGTSSPAEKLHVNGDIRLPAGGDIAFGDNNNLIWESGDDLYLRSDDDIFIRTDDDVYIRTGDNSTNWVRFNNGSRRLGVNTTSPSYTLHVNGRIKTTGINETSDIRLKKNVEDIDGAMEEVMSMRPVTYEWRQKDHPDVEYDDGTQYGLIAQELEKVMPELVETDEEGWKSIEYSHLVPILIEAIQEQQEEIDELEELRGKITSLKASIISMEETINNASLDNEIEK